jgi:hypothetical protein
MSNGILQAAFLLGAGRKKGLFKAPERIYIIYYLLSGNDRLRVWPNGFIKASHRSVL